MPKPLEEKWVEVDLGKEVDIRQIVLHPCHDEFNNIGAGFGFPVRYRVTAAAAGQDHELLEDRSSSYLGKMIDDKTKESYVYNFKENRMGRNPDEIHPGQEIVIVNFKPQELIDIYQHFIDRDG